MELLHGLEFQAAADNYADALFELAVEQDSVEALGDQLHQLGRLLETSEQLRMFLDTPMIGAKERWEFFQKVFGNWASDLLMGLLNVLAHRNRCALLGYIVQQFDVHCDRHAGRVHADLVSARELGEEQLDRLEQILQRYVQKKQVILHPRTDQSLLGGFIVRIGDLQIDASVARGLESWCDELITRGEYEIQR